MVPSQTEKCKYNHIPLNFYKINENGNFFIDMYVRLYKYLLCNTNKVTTCRTFIHPRFDFLYNQLASLHNKKKPWMNTFSTCRKALLMVKAEVQKLESVIAFMT